LPVYRVDLQGKNVQPLNFQWAGSLQSLRDALQQTGWKQPPATSPLQAMNWLAPDPDISTLPLLPQVNDGRHQEMLLIGPQNGERGRLLALRLWPSDRQLLDGNTPVWAGNVAYLYRERDIPFVTYLRTASDFDTPLAQLQESLEQTGRVGMVVRQRAASGAPDTWQGNVLLAWRSAD
jgi:hypothetical protein